MEDMERRESPYGQGGLHSRHILQRLLKRLHRGDKGIDGPPDYPGPTQGGRGKDKPKLLQGEEHLAHCGPEDRTNAGGRRDI